MRALVIACLAFAFGFAGVGAASADIQAHWADNDPTYPHGYAFIHDETGAWAPVYTAAIGWDTETRLDLTYTSGSCTSNHCVPFTERHMGVSGCDASKGTVGLTTWNSSTVGHLLYGTHSELDSDCSSRGYSARLELVCHEMGHTLSLDERGSGALSCMRDGVDLGTQTHGDASDFADLHAAYNHND